MLRIVDRVAREPCGFELVRVERRLADKGPQLIAFGCHRGKLGEQFTHDIGVRTDKGELEGAKLVTKLAVGVSGVGCLRKNTVGVGLEPARKIAGQ